MTNKHIFLTMNFFNLSGNKNECWQNVSGIARAFYAKISAGLRCVATKVVDKSRSLEYQLQMDPLFNEIYVSLLDYHPILQQAPQFFLGKRLWSIVEFFITSTCLLTYVLCCTENRLRNHIILPIRRHPFSIAARKYSKFVCDECVSKCFLGLIIGLFYGAAVLHYQGWPLWVINLFWIWCITFYWYSAYMDVLDPLSSHNEKEYALSKRVFRENAQRKQLVRELKKLLKTSDYCKRKRITKKIEKLESHSAISLKKWTMARELVMTQCTEPGMHAWIRPETK